MTTNLTVIGSGSWGKALAKAFSASQTIAGRADGQNISTDYCIIAVETAHLRSVFAKHKFSSDTVVIIATKGIEQGTLKLPGQIVEELLPNPYAILSGPNFAAEIESGLPAATEIAAKDIKLAKKIVAALKSPNIRIYPSDDVVAAQVCGAVKNVICIAGGICAAQKLGENAKAALITRSLSELSRLIVALGGKTQSLMGLSGIGDIILSASSMQSRNTSFGFAVGSGQNAADIIAERKSAIEGYYTAKSVNALAKKLNVEMPICNEVYEVLYNNKDVKQAVNDLITRPQIF